MQAAPGETAAPRGGWGEKLSIISLFDAQLLSRTEQAGPVTAREDVRQTPAWISLEKPSLSG